MIFSTLYKFFSYDNCKLCWRFCNSSAKSNNKISILHEIMWLWKRAKCVFMCEENFSPYSVNNAYSYDIGALYFGKLRSGYVLKKCTVLVYKIQERIPEMYIHHSLFIFFVSDKTSLYLLFSFLITMILS